MPSTSKQAGFSVPANPLELESNGTVVVVRPRPPHQPQPAPSRLAPAARRGRRPDLLVRTGTELVAMAGAAPRR